MKIIDTYAKQLNPAQKNIAAVITTVVILIMTFVTAPVLSFGYHPRPFDFENTWISWVLGLGLIGYILTRIYSTSNRSV